MPASFQTGSKYRSTGLAGSSAAGAEPAAARSARIVHRMNRPSELRVPDGYAAGFEAFPKIGGRAGESGLDGDFLAEARGDRAGHRGLVDPGGQALGGGGLAVDHERVLQGARVR